MMMMMMMVVMVMTVMILMVMMRHRTFECLQHPGVLSYCLGPRSVELDGVGSGQPLLYS